MAGFAISSGSLFFHFFLLIATIGAQDDYVDNRNDACCATAPQQLGNLVELGKNDNNDHTMDGDDGAVNELATPSVELPNNPNLPSDCGSDQTPEMYGGSELTVPTESPWTVLLEYTGPNRTSTRGGGVLLNERYVLTAANCLYHRDPLTSVRLGEYDTSKVRDCTSSDGVGGEICADDPVSVPIEERIVHELYQRSSWLRRNDIALLRLAWPVRFTNYIRPICLPTTTDVSQKLWLAGWGRDENGPLSNVKQKLAVSLADHIACSQTYKEGIELDLGPSQLCAGGAPAKVVCGCEPGSPLISTKSHSHGRQKWTLVGLVSFGSIFCHGQEWPAIYTKVIDYVPWILGKLRP